MKVAMVHTTFGGMGGTEGFVVQMSQWLVAAGHQVDVWCLDGDDQLAGRLGVRLQRAPKGRVGSTGDRRIHQWSRQIPRDSYDVVHGSGRCARHDVFRAGGGVHRVWLSRRHPGPVGAVRMALSPSERWACRVDLEAVRQARRVICNSDRVAAEMVAVQGVSEEQIVVIRNGVDSTRFQLDVQVREEARVRAGVPRGGRLALFLGSGFRRKGLTVAAQAFAQVATTRDRLVVAGRDAHPERWLGPVRRRLGDRLVVVGPVARPERWLAGADATLLPTLYDAAANTTLEALAAGVPPVTSAMDGSSEVVPDPALVVSDPLDVDGFAGALEHAWRERESLSEACRDAVRPLTWESCGQQVAQVYAEVARG